MSTTYHPLTSIKESIVVASRHRGPVQMTEAASWSVAETFGKGSRLDLDLWLQSLLSSCRLAFKRVGGLAAGGLKTLLKDASKVLRIDAPSAALFVFSVIGCLLGSRMRSTYAWRCSYRPPPTKRRAPLSSPANQVTNVGDAIDFTTLDSSISSSYRGSAGFATPLERGLFAARGDSDSSSDDDDIIILSGEINNSWLEEN